MHFQKNKTKKTESELPTPSCLLGEDKEMRKKELATAVAAAVARRCQQSGKGSVFVQTEQKCDDNGEPAAAENIRAETAVFRAEYE